MLGPLTRLAAKRASRSEQVEQLDDESEREPKRLQVNARAPASAQSASTFRISVLTMAGAAIAIEDASAADTILSVKERVFALNSKLRVRRQRLVYSPGPRGMDALADDETLGGAGVARDGSAELDVLLADLTVVDMTELGSEFLQAAKIGCTRDMVELLDEGADKEFKDECECTALILAAERGHAECVRLLVEAGANKDATDNFGLTALIRAAEKGRTDCVRLLLEGGAGKEANDNNGFTALMWAARLGNSDCVRLLLEGGARKDAKNNGRWTSLMLAAERGKTDCVRLLVEAGADKDAEDRFGYTALIHAANYGHWDSARLLLGW
jgi:hypothetical protein